MAFDKVCMLDMKPNIQIKGIKEGLLVTMSGSSWNDLHPLLISELEQKREFLKGASLAIDVDTLEFKGCRNRYPVTGAF